VDIAAVLAVLAIGAIGLLLLVGRTVGVGLAIYTGGPPVIDCVNAEPEVCEQALRERGDFGRAIQRGAGPVVYFRLESANGGTCGEWFVSYAVGTFGPFVWLDSDGAQPLCQ
jgi:hypothetical protein